MLLAVLLASAGWASTATAEADWLNRGWFSTSSWGYSYYTIGFDASDYEYRSWFEFTLPGWSAAPVSAELYLDTLTADTTETWQLHGYSTRTFAGIAAGPVYGTYVYNDPADEHQLAAFALNATAMSDIIAAGPGGAFKLGGVQTTHGSKTYEEIFYGVPADGYKVQLVLTFADTAVPEPSSIVLFGAGLALLAGARRFSKLTRRG